MEQSNSSTSIVDPTPNPLLDYGDEKWTFETQILYNVLTMNMILSLLLWVPKIKKERSTGEINIYPYLVMILRCLIVGTYFITTHDIRIWNCIVNFFGCIYGIGISFFFYHCCRDENQRKRIRYTCLILIVLGCFYVLLFFLNHKMHENDNGLINISGVFAILVDIVLAASPIPFILVMYKKRNLNSDRFSLSLSISIALVGMSSLFFYAAWKQCIYFYVSGSFLIALSVAQIALFYGCKHSVSKKDKVVPHHQLQQQKENLVQHPIIKESLEISIVGTCEP
ncbi:hypothetical protein CYY_009267 [Polysphondylium violaceum]|uniref:Uncharacterized protein n=1 Tax=Polysphondylium violaceum TaxID=133409 RepID=A0A8J4PM42_9MYCE|nr:hypothetical protein CYY_009267 [Polysphondylium violaceum]